MKLVLASTALMLLVACGGVTAAGSADSGSSVHPDSGLPESHDSGPSGTPDADHLDSGGPDSGAIDAGPVTTNGGDLHFAVSSIDIWRDVPCGTPNPPFSPTDSLAMNVVGPATQAPYSTIFLEIKLTAAVGVPVALDLDPWAPKPGPVVWQDDAGAAHIDSNPEDAHSADGLIHLTFDRGVDPTMLDAAAFDQATITIVAMPAKDGDVLSARVQLNFADGHTLDQTYSGPVPPLGANTCPPG